MHGGQTDSEDEVVANRTIAAMKPRVVTLMMRLSIPQAKRDIFRLYLLRTFTMQLMHTTSMTPTMIENTAVIKTGMSLVPNVISFCRTVE